MLLEVLNYRPVLIFTIQAAKTKSLRRYQELREAEQKRLEKPFVSDIAKLFRMQMELIVGSVKRLGGMQFEAVAPEVKPGDKGPILVKMMDVLRRTRPTAERVFRTGISKALKGGQTINRGIVSVNAKADFTLWNKITKEFLEYHLPKLTDAIEDQTLQRVSRLVSRAIEKGTTADALSSDIRSLFRNMSKGRAATIAQTEIGMAQSVADFTAAERIDIDLVKIWSSSRDERVRTSHQIREAREMLDRFSNGLLYPLEPGAPASEVVNCRCTILSVPRDEAPHYGISVSKSADAHGDIEVLKTDDSDAPVIEVTKIPKLDAEAKTVFREFSNAFTKAGYKNLKEDSVIGTNMAMRAMSARHIDVRLTSGLEKITHISAVDRVGEYQIKQKTIGLVKSLSDRNVAKTLIHEYGHHIDFEFFGFEGLDFSFPSKVSEAGKIMRTEATTEFYTARTKALKRIEKSDSWGSYKYADISSALSKIESELEAPSVYALSNTQEWFAESWSNYIYSPSALKRVAPKTYSLIDKLVKGELFE